jgi:hydrogenase maturation protein HypF
MIERWQLTIQGNVQGVGFRPFVYRLAMELNLGGWIINSSQGVMIEVEAENATLDRFLSRLQDELPPHASICELTVQSLPVQGDREFAIRHSEDHGVKSARILPDLATCPDCLHDISDPTNRRYRYPFTNCTNCGPRFSIILDLPYDRPNTTMHGFTLCEECRAEYENPLDRRFHAQPNACPRCGPQLALWDRDGRRIAVRDEALYLAAQSLRYGRVVAVKGLGGFHLMVDARNPEAVALLRARKGRYEKPLAVMFPSLDQIRQHCEVSEMEQTLLTSAASPIVLLRCRDSDIAPEVAPDNPYLGVILPYTPLHHLLLSELGFPVVATSGNLSGEPICTDEKEALEKLGNVADIFLVHDRPIARPVDDSVICVAAGQLLTLRRARGYAPQPVDIPNAGQHTLVAVGAHQKNTTALLHNGHVFLSQHLGDMDSPKTVDVFRRTLADFQSLYDAAPSAVVCDMHPDYATTQFAEQSGMPIVRVQHHHAHILSCIAEHHLEPPILGVAWDGTGYGQDNTIWGSEFLLIEHDGFQRVAHLRPYPLPGGDMAAREPRRSLLGLLYTMYGADLPRQYLQFHPSELTLLLSVLEKGLHAPMTSSMGRLFDAVAALAGLQQKCSFEGQAAMALEYAALEQITDECYPYEITPITNASHAGSGIMEWKLMLAAMLSETKPALLSAKFHNTLVRMIVDVAQRMGIQQVALTGGCFQNRVLLERSVSQLRTAGFTPYWQQRIPPNDGGIALGQIAAALREGRHVLSSSRKVDQHKR